jgi:hypothetical protein
VPVFLDGDLFERFEKTREVDVTPQALLLGAVFHADGEAPGVDPTAFLEHLKAMLDVLTRGLGEDDTEALVVDVTAILRERHGSALALLALRRVVKTFPTFHQARSDLVTSTWFEALDAGEPERPKLAAAVLEAFGGLDRSGLRPGPRAVACYAAVSATVLLEGVDQARRLLGELGAELDAGDEGELRVKLEAFLGSGGKDWEGLRFAVT